MNESEQVGSSMHMVLENDAQGWWSTDVYVENEHCDYGKVSSRANNSIQQRTIPRFRAASASRFWYWHSEIIDYSRL